MGRWLVMLGMLALPADADDLEAMKSALARHGGAPAAGVCSVLPAAAVPVATMILAGSEQGTVDQALVEKVLSRLPAVEGSGSGQQYASLDAAEYLRVAACVCFLESGLAQEPDNAALLLDYEVALFHVYFWREVLPSSMLAVALSNAVDPGLMADPQFPDFVARNVEVLVPVVEKGYADAAARRLAGVGLTDASMLGRMQLFMERAGDFAGAAVAAALVDQVSQDPWDCVEAARAHVRALEVKKGKELYKGCRAELTQRVKEADQSMDRMARAAGVAGKYLNDPDGNVSLEVANALFDLGRDREGDAVLARLVAGGEMDAATAQAEGLRLVRMGHYFEAIAAVVDLPEEQWTKGTVRVLGGATALLLMGEIYTAASNRGKAGVRDALDGRRNWFGVVVDKIGTRDPALAGYLRMLFDAVYAGVTDKGTGTFFQAAGGLLAEQLREQKQRLGTDPSWGRLAVAAALLTNRQEGADALAAAATRELDPGEDLYPSALGLQIALELFRKGELSRASVEAASKKGAPQLSVLFLGSSEWLSAVLNGQPKKAATGLERLKALADAIPGKSRVKSVALNNLAVGYARTGQKDAAIAAFKAATDAAANDDDLVMFEMNYIALTTEDEGLQPRHVDYLMSVASGSSSTLARYVASRILLKNKASVPGLKVQAVEAASNDAFGELNARGLFDPELRMAVQADVNLAVAPIRKYGGDVDVEFRVTLDAVLYQWY